MSLFPHDKTGLLTGPVRVLWALTSVAKPANITDVITTIGASGVYAPKTGWNDFGATSDETTYERDFDSDELYIEQSNLSVLERINEVTRSAEIPIAELTPEAIQIIEEGGDVESVAAATNRGAEETVGVGSFDSLTRYRLAFIAQRDPGFGGTVREGASGPYRGPLVMFVAYQAQLAAEGAELSLAKDDLSSMPVTFRFFPDSSVTDPQESVGRFHFESPGTIAIV